MLEEALVLLQDMLRLAEADALRLPAPAWLCEQLNSMQAAASASAEGAGRAAAAAAVREGDWLCLPQHDAPVNPLLLQAYAEGSVEQVLGLLPHNELELAVTAARQQPGRGGAGGAAGAGDASGLSYKTLEVCVG